MNTGRPSDTEVIATYSVPFAILYTFIILAMAGVVMGVTFTGEPIASYLERKPGMAPLPLFFMVCFAIEISRCVIIFYNIFANRGRALFARGGKIVFISRYFSSIPIAQIVRVLPRKKKAVYVILSTGKLKKIYTVFLKPSDPRIVAQKIEALVQGAHEE